MTFRLKNVADQYLTYSIKTVVLMLSIVTIAAGALMAGCSDEPELTAPSPKATAKTETAQRTATPTPETLPLGGFIQSHYELPYGTTILSTTGTYTRGVHTTNHCSNELTNLFR